MATHTANMPYLGLCTVPVFLVYTALAYFILFTYYGRPM